MKCLDCGYEWTTKPGHILKGSGCPMCMRKQSGLKHRLSPEEFKQRIPKHVKLLTEYQHYNSEIKCKCKICGYEWATLAKYLLDNNGCPKCNKTLRHTTETFKELVAEKSPNIEVLEEYSTEKIKYHCKCKICGHEWYPHAIAIKKGQKNCPICAAKEASLRYRKTLEQFIIDAKQTHGDKYDYSKVEYINNDTKVRIICPKHGEFWQTPGGHLQGHTCPKCNLEKMSIARRWTTDQFIEAANKIHNNKYDYNESIYIDKRHPIDIICPIHGKFTQLAGNHIRGTGCPHCKQSKGEKLIFDILSKNDFKFKSEYTIKHKINNRSVRVDFVVYHNSTYKSGLNCNHFLPSHKQYFSQSLLKLPRSQRTYS